MRCNRRRKAGRAGWGDGSAVRALAALAENLGVAPAAAVTELSTGLDTLTRAKPGVYPHSMAALTSAFSIPNRSSPGASCLVTGTAVSTARDYLEPSAPLHKLENSSRTQRGRIGPNHRNPEKWEESHPSDGSNSYSHFRSMAEGLSVGP